ncbi:MAG: 4Fe-4S binding protein [Anaerolineales bacterium]
MIAIDQTRCTGCGECVSVCPNGAVTLVAGIASVNEAVCEECEVCLGVCPHNAIISVEAVEPELSRGTLPDPKPAQIQVESTSPPSVKEALPVLSSVMVSTGREVLPRLASMAMDLLDQRVRPADNNSQVKNAQTRQQLPKQGKRGRQRRQRRRRQGKR